MPTSLSLVSWNVHGIPFTSHPTRRLREVAQRVQREQPDIVHFQEVWLPAHADLFTSLLKDDYAPVPGSGDGWVLRTGGLLTFLRRGRVRLLGDPTFHPFDSHAEVWKLWEGDGLSHKGVQQMLVERDGTRLWLLNTHLQASYTPNDYRDIRLRQLHELRQVAAQLDTDLPLIAAGDLNTAPAELLEAHFDDFWLDLTTAHRETCGCGTHFNSDGSEADWIDYILARRAGTWTVTAEVRRLENVGSDNPYSDHQGLLATVTLQRSPLTSMPLSTLALHLLAGPSTRRRWLLGLGVACVGRLESVSGGRKSQNTA